MAGVALALVAGIGALVALQSLDGPVLPSEPNLKHREVTWPNEDYVQSVHNPRYERNRFPQQAVLVRVGRGEAEQPLLVVSHAGETSYVYRLPSIW